MVGIRVSTEKCRILASSGKMRSGRLPEMWDPGKYRKGRNPGEMLENPKQAKRSKQTQGKVVGPSMTSRVYQKMTRIIQKSNTIMKKEGGMPQYDNRKCHK